MRANSPIALAFALAALLVAAPVGAEDRPAWDAELWSLEEGERLVASVTSIAQEGEEEVPTLALMCGGRSTYRLRYDPGPQADVGIDWTGRTATFEFRAGASRIALELQFEAMDAMWAVSLGREDRLVAAITGEAEMVVLMPHGGQGENRFSLRGSSKAIAEMRASCR